MRVCDRCKKQMPKECDVVTAKKDEIAVWRFQSTPFLKSDKLDLCDECEEKVKEFILGFNEDKIRYNHIDDNEEAQVRVCFNCGSIRDDTEKGTLCKEFSAKRSR